MPELAPPFVLGWDVAGVIDDPRLFAVRDRRGRGRDDPVGAGRRSRRRLRAGGSARRGVARAATGRARPGVRGDGAAERAHRAPGAGPDRSATGLDAADHRRQRRRRRVRDTARRARRAAGTRGRLRRRRGVGQQPWRRPRCSPVARASTARSMRCSMRSRSAPSIASRDGGVALFTRRIADLDPERGLRYEMPLVHPDAGDARPT